MDSWILEKEGFDPRDAAGDGNRFLSANGYLGLRGAPEEAGPELFPAINLAGVYDRHENLWREPVNAPNCLYLDLEFNGRPLALGRAEPLRHRMEICYRDGVLSRETDFGPVLLSTRRFASMADCHALADRVRLTLREEGELTLRAGVSLRIWDINGPHLFGFRLHAGDVLSAEGRTGEKGIAVAAAQCLLRDFDATEETLETGEGVFRLLRRKVHPGEVLTLDLFAAVWTSLDLPAADPTPDAAASASGTLLDPAPNASPIPGAVHEPASGESASQSPADAARETCLRAAGEGFPRFLELHRQAWDRIRSRSEIQAETDPEALRFLRASQYHLNAIAPRHADNLSVPARGLSGQTYKGAIFWDSEMFLFPMFVHTQPEIARSLLRYRIETLPGARKKAAEYGFRGAFYAWESQEGGAEGCTNFNVVDVFTHRPVRTWFRDKQIHISGDIVYALRSWWEITGDRTLLEQGGAEVILECARFYLSRASARLDGDAVDYQDVIGPDEYHERVSNNAYTNRIIRHTVETALALEEIFRDQPDWFAALLSRLDYARDWQLLRSLPARIRPSRRRGQVVEQFDGYFDLEDCTLAQVRARLADPREYWGGDHGVAGPTQIIKQADVITLAALFPGDFTDGELAENWDYYEPRTEHGSSLSACMYALTACRVGRLEEAWSLFLRTAGIDVTGGGKQWAGEIYIGGTHPASNGGAWMIAALGFAGLRVRAGKAELHPRLPKALRSLSFPLTLAGQSYRVEVTPDGGTIIPE